MAERLAAAARLTARAKAADASQREDHANLGLRLLAYLLDSIVLFGFTCLFAGIAMLNVLLRSGEGRRDLSDAAARDFVLILLATVPAWLAVNLALGVKRKQTIGQFVLGLRIQRADGGAISLRRLLVYWLALHPLLFHPMFALLWGLLALVTLSLYASNLVFLPALAMALLCSVAPLAGLVFALIDPQRRTLHDRLAELTVVRLE